MLIFDFLPQDGHALGDATVYIRPGPAFVTSSWSIGLDFSPHIYIYTK